MKLTCCVHIEVHAKKLSAKESLGPKCKAANPFSLDYAKVGWRLPPRCLQ